MIVWNILKSTGLTDYIGPYGQLLQTQNQQFMTLNIVTVTQYAERVMLHIEIAEFVPDNTELTSLFLQLLETIRKSIIPIYITHIISHIGLPTHTRTMQ